MRSDDLDAAVETYAQQLMRAHPVLKGKAIVHFEEDKEASSDRIVLKATRGDRRLDGPGGFNVELKATHYSTTSDAKRNSLTRKAMVEALYEPVNTNIPAAALFSVLILNDPMNTDRSVSDNSREYTATFPFIAKKAV